MTYLPTPQHAHLVLDLVPPELSGEPPANPGSDDQQRLRMAYFDAFRETERYIGTTDEVAWADAEERIAKWFTGRYGQISTPASFARIEHGVIQAFTLVTEFRGAPRLAVWAVPPAYQGLGAGRTILAWSVQALWGAGERELHAYLDTGESQALATLGHLGFQPIRG